MKYIQQTVVDVIDFVTQVFRKFFSLHVLNMNLKSHIAL